MQYISSKAGTRLAKAKARRDSLVGTFPAAKAQANRKALSEATVEFQQAANALADELIEQGFHRTEGD